MHIVSCFLVHILACRSSFLSFSINFFCLQAYIVPRVLMFLILYNRYARDGELILFLMVHILTSECSHLEMTMISLKKVWGTACFWVVRRQLGNIRPLCMVLTSVASEKHLAFCELQGLGKIILGNRYQKMLARTLIFYWICLRNLI